MNYTIVRLIWHGVTMFYNTNPDGDKTEYGVTIIIQGEEEDV